MLRRLAVQGFQSLADIDIELAPFTVIVGASNSGKSALRRALEAMVTNASATGRLRTGAAQITVVAEHDDGSSVIWEKGTKRNAYTLQLADGDVVVQDKPGSKPTPEVTELLGLDELNFVDQFQPPYLLTQTPANAAKALGALTNVTVLYDGIREATKRQRTHAQTATVLEDQLDTAAAELATYEWLPAEAEQLNVASAALAAAREAGTTYANLHADFGTAHQLHANIAAAAEALDASHDLDAIAAVLATAADAAAAAWGAAADVEQARQILGVLATPLPPAWDVTHVVDATADADRLTNDLMNARALAQAIAEQRTAADVATANEDAARQTLATIDACPMCHQSTQGLTA